MVYPPGGGVATGLAEIGQYKGANSPVAARQALIPDELQRVEKQIDNVGELVQILEQRIDSALRPSAPDTTAPGGINDLRPSIGVPLADSLQSAQVRLCAITARLNSLLERIEL